MGLGDGSDGCLAAGLDEADDDIDAVKSVAQIVDALVVTRDDLPASGCDVVDGIVTVVRVALAVLLVVAQRSQDRRDVFALKLERGGRHLSIEMLELVLMHGRLQLFRRDAETDGFVWTKVVHAVVLKRMTADVGLAAAAVPLDK